MGGAPYIGLGLGDGMIFEVAISRLDAKERPGSFTALALLASPKRRRGRRKVPSAYIVSSCINIFCILSIFHVVTLTSHVVLAESYCTYKV